MSDTNSLYTNKERKRILVGELEKQLRDILEANDALDNKAWNVLSVTSATLGLVSSLQIVLSDQVPFFFWFVLVLVFIIYLLLVRELMGVITPQQLNLVPGVHEGETTYTRLMEKYIPIDDDEYWTRVMIDYIGAYDVDNPDEYLDGAIQVAQRNNHEKAEHIRTAIAYFSAIIIGLILMAITIGV